MSGMTRLACLSVFSTPNMCGPIPDGLPCLWTQPTDRLGVQPCSSASPAVERPPYCVNRPGTCDVSSPNYDADSEMQALTAIKSQLGNPSGLSSWAGSKWPAAPTCLHICACPPAMARRCVSCGCGNGQCDCPAPALCGRGGGHL